MNKIAAILLSTVMLFLTACSMSEDTTIAEAEVSKFHAKLGSGDFQGIYLSSGEELQKATSEADFTALLEAINRKLGPLQDASRETWNVNYHTSGTFVTLGYKSRFQNGSADEQFVYRIKGKSAKLVGYHINSTALIVN